MRPWNLVRTTSSGCIAATVVNPATAPAVAFSHCQCATIKRILEFNQYDLRAIEYRVNRKLKRAKGQLMERFVVLRYDLRLCVCFFNTTPFQSLVFFVVYQDPSPNVLSATLLRPKQLRSAPFFFIIPAKIPILQPAFNIRP